jgi:predicted amidohydrolase YtcJ
MNFVNGKYRGQPWSMGVSGGRFVDRADGPVTDLQGYEVLPGFIDAHSHILPTGLDLLKLNLSACSSPSDVLDAVAAWNRERPGEGWLHAVQYDQTKFPGATHLTRHDLDRVVGERPVLLRHSTRASRTPPPSRAPRSPRMWKTPKAAPLFATPGGN